MELILISAVAKNGVIGREGKLPWNLSEDLKHFKELTSGFPVLMGRVTYESIINFLGKPLPDRLNIVITKNKSQVYQEGVIFVDTIEKAIEIAESYSKAFIIGGQKIYSEFLKKGIVDKLELTEINREFEGDAFFPKINQDEWVKVSSIEKSENGINYSFNSYKKKKKGKLIVFEGTDCSGKATQIKLLAERLKKEGKTFEFLDFPNYSTPTGKIVRRYLDNEFGPANQIPAKIASIFYAEDRFAQKPFIEEVLKRVDFVISDRYVGSNMAHQGGKMSNTEQRKEFFKWNEEMEFNSFGLPRPDAVILLYMPPVCSSELLKNRVTKSIYHPGQSGNGDGHEADPNHLKNAAETYLQLAEMYDWLKIDCAPDGTMSSIKTPEEISEEVYQKLISLNNSDKSDEIFSLIEKEKARQQLTLNMIPSENYASPKIMEACGSVLMNKYSEGYPGKRYYQGNEFVDNIENMAISRAKQLFSAEHANVQPNSGSSANFAAFLAFLQPGDKFLGPDLAAGGHLTHGSPVNFSGKIYQPISYFVEKESGLIDMEKVREIAIRERPKMIISGYTAYPRKIDFKKFQEIAEEVGAIHLADISHIAGLVAAGVHPSPVPFADVVTLTTHKTLRGPRSAIILCKEKYAKQVDKSVFPGSQGGPHEHTIAGKAIAFKEALNENFKDYSRQIVLNAQKLAEVLVGNGIKLVTGGTDNHLILVDLTPFGIGLGRDVAIALEKAGIVCNANSIPYDPSTPFKPSGLRFGTPMITTRGMKEEEMEKIGDWISQIIRDSQNELLINKTRKEVEKLCLNFPVDLE